MLKALTLDIGKRRGDPFRAKRAELWYEKRLRLLADQVDLVVGKFESGDLSQIPFMQRMLEQYSELMTPWAEGVAQRMLEDVASSSRYGWYHYAKTHAEEISKGLLKDIQNAPVGNLYRQMMEQQVTLIKSIPLEAAQRLHDLAIKAAGSDRAESYIAEIMRSGQVARSRAELIARTEVSRAASNFTQARARYVGSQGYVWMTSKDRAVRPSHEEMQGVVVRWDEPPTLDGMTGHAGCLPNCRCWARVILPE